MLHCVRSTGDSIFDLQSLDVKVCIDPGIKRYIDSKTSKNTPLQFSYIPEDSPTTYLLFC